MLNPMQSCLTKPFPYNRLTVGEIEDSWQMIGVRFRPSEHARLKAFGIAEAGTFSDWARPILLAAAGEKPKADPRPVAKNDQEATFLKIVRKTPRRVLLDVIRLVEACDPHELGSSEVRAFVRAAASVVQLRATPRVDDTDQPATVPRRHGGGKG